VLFAGQLTGKVSPMQLAVPDLVLLSMFLSAKDPLLAAQQLHSGNLSRFLPAVPTINNIIGRIRQMTQAQVLVAGTDKHAGDASVITAKHCTAAPARSDDLTLSLGTNIALRPSSSGFRVWSARTRQNYTLSLEMVLLLVSFCPRRSLDDVIRGQNILEDRNSSRNAIYWLLETGILVEAREEQSTLQAFDPPSSDVIVKPATTFPETLEPWQKIRPDGRIPVYFTPHMENHYPLALGMIYSSICAYNDGALLKKFQLLPITYMTPDELFNGPYRKFGSGVWLFSNYMWSLDVNLQISSALKSRNPQNLTIHGGPSTPAYQQACSDFMATNTSVDIAVHGEGEITVVELLEHVYRNGDGNITYKTQDLNHVDGLTFRDTTAGVSGLVRSSARSRLKEPDSIPSPYLSHAFDVYEGNVEAAIIETNRGCPFGCTFCDWGSATQQKVRKFDLDRVKQEIDWIARNGTRVLWIADANYGMYERDIELSEFIVETKNRYGFPREVVVNYTKNTTRRLTEIIKAFSAGGIISQGIISIQTTDEKTLEVINRQNIKVDKYDELAQIFAEENLPLSTDLMMALPGITVEAFDRDLQRYFDVDVSVKAYPTQLLPNSPMADPEYIKKYRIEVDKDDFVVSCFSFSRSELDDMKGIFKFFEVADGHSVLRYVLRFLQWEHDIKAMDFLHALYTVISESPERYPSITWAMRFFVTDKFMPGGWKSFYDEIADFIEASWGIIRDDIFDTVLLVNELVMPDETVRYPVRMPLKHDFIQWFKDHNNRDTSVVKPLKDYPPGEFMVNDPDAMAGIDMDFVQYDSHQYFWELRSEIARATSVSDKQTLRQPGLES